MKKLLIIILTLTSALTFGAECNLPDKQLYENSVLISKFQLHFFFRDMLGVNLGDTPEESFAKMQKQIEALEFPLIKRDKESDSDKKACMDWALGLDFETIGRDDIEKTATQKHKSVEYVFTKALEKIKNVTLANVIAASQESQRIEEEVYREVKSIKEAIPGMKNRKQIYTILFEVKQKVEVICSFYDRDVRLIDTESKIFRHTSEKILFMSGTGHIVDSHICKILKSL